MAVRKSAESTGRVASDRLEDQTAGWIHRILERPGWPDVLFAYHDKITLGPTAMKVLANKTGLAPKDL